VKKNALPMISRLQGAFITGLIVMLPVAVAIVVGRWLLNFFSGWEADLLRGWIGLPDPAPVHLALALQVGAFLLTCLVILLVGLLANSFFGRRMIVWLDLAIERLPLVGSVYDATRQLVQAFQGGSGRFREVVLVEFPQPGSRAVGFVTGSMDVASAEGGRRLIVFVPTSPNPTSGFLLVTDPAKVIYLDMSTEEGFKFVLSGGLTAGEKGLKTRPHPDAV
jgi:uncharacterized membrane protein